VLALYGRELRRLNRAPRTIHARVLAAKRFLGATRKPVTKLTPADVRAYLAARALEGVSRTTQRNELYALRGFFRAARDLGLAESDPTASLRVEGGDTPARLVLGVNEVRSLLAAASAPCAAEPATDGDAPTHRGDAAPGSAEEAHPGQGESAGADDDADSVPGTPVALSLVEAVALRDRALIELLYAVGLRASEAEAARVVDLDLAQGTLLCRRAKRGRSRVLPLPPACLPALARYLERGRPRLVRAEVEDQGHLFLSRRGRPLAYRGAVYGVVRRLARRAGVRAHPHAVRRATATHLARQGVNLGAIQALLGHVNVATTSIYLGVDPAELRAAVETLEVSPPDP
jgi:site-specific recombinase XerD